ncbi:hypothetical protein [Halobellus captivus]|uniref:hypothetical protein n=1 Tax=Halobellus captivus TaxID=2592614 RepID=UPI00119E7FC8|nr:hypothetical protein [Halobellus captivus]
MNGTPIVVIALLVAVGAGVVIVGDDVLPGSSGDDTEPFPTASTPQDTAESDSGSNGASDGSDADAAVTSTPPFGFVIENVEECGTTCREVTTTLTNNQDTTAEDTTVYSRIFAGQGTDGDEVWRGEEPVGTLESGESYTATREVDLSFSEAMKVRNEDGWITIQTTVQTADRTVTFTEQRQVL